MATVDLSAKTIVRLKTHAEPLTDTYDSVVSRLLDSYEGMLVKPIVIPSVEAGDVDAEAAKLNPLSPPDFTVARIRGDFGGIAFDNWNSLLRVAHAAAYKKVVNFDALRRITRAQIREGVHTDAGYKPVPGTSISLQGVDANRAWEYALSLAQYLQVPIIATVEWLNHPKAKLPGQRRLIRFLPGGVDPL